MPERQLHLFQPSRPLAARLGDDFFRAASPGPGVYIMTGADEQILYIGQSKNLRARLGSYKNARRDRAPRKVLQLVHQVRNITWEKCESADAAIARESELLRLHRPRFNRANVYPTYVYLWLRTHNEAVTLGRTNYQAGAARAPATAEFEAQAGDTKVYGPFRTFAVPAYGALLRLLWTVTHNAQNPSDFPCGLWSEKPPRIFTIHWPGGHGLPNTLLVHLTDFLAGNSDSLIAALAESLPSEQNFSSLQRALHTHDLEVLAEFCRVRRRKSE